MVLLIGKSAGINKSTTDSWANNASKTVWCALWAGWFFFQDKLGNAVMMNSRRYRAMIVLISLY